MKYDKLMAAKAQKYKAITSNISFSFVAKGTPTPSFTMTSLHKHNLNTFRTSRYVPVRKYTSGPPQTLSLTHEPAPQANDPRAIAAPQYARIHDGSSLATSNAHICGKACD